jgi:hypothetical protein
MQLSPRARQLFAVAIVASITASASAGENAVEDARRLYLAGRQAFAAGRLDLAAESFEAAFRLERRPALLWNLGQTYRRQFLLQQKPQLLRQAVDAYRRYLIESPTGDNREEAERLLAELTPLVLRLEATSADVSTPPPPSPAKTELMIVAEAEHASVSLDDEPPAPAPILFAVKEGHHRARVDAPGYFPTEMSLTAVAGRLVTAEARLTPRPSRVDVRAATGTQLYIDREAMGPLPHAPFELPAGEHALAMVKRGRKPWSTSLALGRGESVQVWGTLTPTRQRRVAPWIAGAAGLAAALSIAFGIVWQEKDGAANTLHQMLNSGQLLPAQYMTYLNDRDSRDQFRTATIVSLCLTGALGLTAGALYYFDTPNPPEGAHR